MQPPAIPVQVPCGDAPQVRCAEADLCGAAASCPGHASAVCVPSFCAAQVAFAGHNTSSACVAVWVNPATGEGIPECGGFQTYGGSGNPTGAAQRMLPESTPWSVPIALSSSSSPRLMSW